MILTYTSSILSLTERKEIKHFISVMFLKFFQKKKKCLAILQQLKTMFKKKNNSSGQKYVFSLFFTDIILLKTKLLQHCGCFEILVKIKIFT